MSELAQNDFIIHLLSLLMQYQQGDSVFKNALREKASELGVVKFIEEVATPLGVAIGDMWFAGQMNVFIEHYYTTQLTELLNDLIIQSDAQKSLNQPRILLGTLSGERHILGLNMAQTLLCSQGAFCINLGAELPVVEFVDAINFFNINVIGLSFSPVFPKRMMFSLLRQMRANIADSIEIWIGGRGTREFEENIDGISIVNSADEIIEAYQLTQRRLLKGV